MLIFRLKSFKQFFKNRFASLGTVAVYTTVSFLQAKDNNYIDDDYFVWWGYEDKKLFEYAKTEILKQAEKDAPFNVTLLTVDTHFMEGYQCEDCLETHEDPYLNTLNCSSKQIYNFVEWIKEQDFYENTTIVIAGDHLNMGGDYIGTIPRDYNRTVYFTIVNSAVEYTGNGEHLYTTLDFFPTTLAAMGVKIEGDRLGLGTNLFSSKKTLTEELGVSEEVAAEDACKVEHVISEETFAALKVHLEKYGRK